MSVVPLVCRTSSWTESPAENNKTDEGRQANRRVEIQISANEKLQQQDAQHQQQAQQGQQAAATPARP